MRRADGPVTSPISRCTACGAWTWLIETYGCPTCIRLWASYGVTTDTEEKE